MIVKSCMKRNVVSIPLTATIREAAQVFVKHHIGLLPVINEDEKPVGMIGMRDMLTLEMPDFINFVADVDFVHDFGAVEDTRPSAQTLDQTVDSLMKTPFTVDEESGLLRTYALMLQHNLHDVLVVSKEGRLIGITSRVDIGVAILTAWQKVDQ